MESMLRGAAARAARRHRHNASRRGLSSGANGPSPSSAPSSTGASGATKANKAAAERGGVEALESVTPGITRIRKGNSGRVVEVDSTIARMIGSDWGDRRNQSVSLPMRLYWIIFGVVLANGVYTYFSGKDEKYLVDKIQKKVDEKLGVVETNEFVVMADEQKSSKPAAASTNSPTIASAAVASEPRISSPPASVFTSSAAPTTMPFFRPSAAPAAAQPKSKADLQAQLQQLRVKQQHLQQELASGASFRDLDDIEVEIRLLDQQKAQVKRMIKRL